MNHIFANYIWEKWLKIYMDDLGIHTKNDLILHYERTQKVLLRLREHGLIVQLSKTVSNAPCMKFLEMIIGQRKVEMYEKKLDAIKEWKPPTMVKGVQSFIVFTDFYHKFIPNFSNMYPLELAKVKRQTMEVDTTSTEGL